MYHRTVAHVYPCLHTLFETQVLIFRWFGLFFLPISPRFLLFSVVFFSFNCLMIHLTRRVSLSMGPFIYFFSFSSSFSTVLFSFFLLFTTENVRGLGGVFVSPWSRTRMPKIDCSPTAEDLRLFCSFLFSTHWAVEEKKGKEMRGMVINVSFFYHRNRK